MPLPTYTGDTGIIAALSTYPNDTDGLTDAQLKAKFDEGVTALKAWINETFIPAIMAGNVPFSATDAVPESDVQNAIENVQAQLAAIALGSIPDGSITAAKLAANAVTYAKLAAAVTATVEQALAGTATDVFLSPAVTVPMINAIKAKILFPYETLTAVYTDTITAGATVTKSISHTLGAVPSRLKVFFAYSGTAPFSACVDMTYDGTNYNYTMSGVVAEPSENSGGVWKKSNLFSTDAVSYLFGRYGSYADRTYGTEALGNVFLRLKDITMTDSAISIPFTNVHNESIQLYTRVTVEVYE